MEERWICRSCCPLRLWSRILQSSIRQRRGPGRLYMTQCLCPRSKRGKHVSLNLMLQEKCMEYLFHRIQGKESPVGKMITKDREELNPLPGHTFGPWKRTTGHVYRFCTVRFDSNNYSAPAAHCGREVSVKARAWNSFYLLWWLLHRTALAMPKKTDHLQTGALSSLTTWHGENLYW